MNQASCVMDSSGLEKTSFSLEKMKNTEKIKWNFTKFLIDREGNVIKRFSPQKKPEQIKTEIEKLL